MNEQTYPKISIVTACYNHAAYVGETIESILSQGYPNLEYIVIDDGSTDGSWDVIQRNRPRLTYCERLEGYRDTPVVALNHGFEKTSGEIMLFLNSDDVLLPRSLFVLAKIYREHPEVEWLTGMATTINSRSEIVNSKLRLKHRYDFLSGNWKVIQQESTCWRRSLWERTGGTLEGEKKWAFDTELWTRFFEQAEHYHAAVPLGAFRAGAQSKSVSNLHSFTEPNAYYLNRFRKRSKRSFVFFALLYRCLRYFHPLLSPIPHRYYQQIPLLRRFGYHVLEYSFTRDRWEPSSYNPFR